MSIFLIFPVSWCGHVFRTNFFPEGGINVHE